MSKRPGRELLRDRMAELGWTQMDVANDIGTIDGNVSRWLSGQRTPSLKMAFRLQASKLGIPAHAWLEEDVVAAHRKAG